MRDLVKKLRSKHKMTQFQFAKSLDVTQGYLSKLECGDNKPNLFFVWKLRTVYMVNINKWLDEIRDEL